MKFNFERWTLHGQTFLILNFESLLNDGVVVEVFSDPAGYRASITLTFKDATELELSFNDVHGRQEVAPCALSWHELEAEAAAEGEYKLNDEFWRAYEYLVPDSVEQE